MKMASLIEFPFSSQINEQVLQIRRLSRMIIEWFHHVTFCRRTRELVRMKELYLNQLITAYYRNWMNVRNYWTSFSAKRFIDVHFLA